MTAGATMGQSGSLAFASEVPRTNYLIGGLQFGGAYDSNVAASGTEAASDVSYYVSPNIALKQTRGRLGWDLSYKPGFTFYQHVAARNEADHVFGGNVQYRLSPHVTLTASDSFVRTSNVFNQVSQDPAGGTTSGALNASIVTPVADRISNATEAGVSYQFGLNSMVGASGMTSQLWYPNPSQVPGLYDSSEYMGEAYYTHRFSGRHYLGVKYRFQQLMAHPINTQTNAHSAVLFYTFLINSSLSTSLYGGPQYSENSGGGVIPLLIWTPMLGGALNWHGEHTSLALSASRQVSPGYGLSGASKSTVADAAVRRQLSNRLTVGASADYTMDRVLNPAVGTSDGGHVISGTVTLIRQLGQHFGLEIGYTRLHQTYADIPAIANTPNRQRVWASVSYQFQRPLGR
jgi:hypothetical protein